MPEEMHRRYLENSPNGIVIVNERGKILEANRMAVLLTEYTEKELLGTSIFDLFSPDFRPGWEKWRIDPCLNEKFIDDKSLLTGKSGDLRNIRIEAVHWKKDEYLLFFRDITTQKQAEIARIKSEENLAIILDSIGEGVIATDREGKIIRMNPVAENLTGRSMAEAVGQDLFGVFKIVDAENKGPAVFSPDAIRKKGKLTKTGAPAVLEAGNGSRRKIDASVSPILNKAGKITGAVLVFRDVTHAEALREKLRQAQRMEAVGNLAGGIAHNLNNILFPITGYAEMVLAGLSEEKSPLRESIEQILSSANRAVELVQEVLAVSRLNRQERMALSLEPIVTDTLKRMKDNLPDRVEIRTEIRKNTGYVLANPVHIQRIVRNLCGNAGHAMKENGGTIRLILTDVRIPDDEAVEELPSCNYVKLSVRDTGCGIDSVVMERIFDPYFTTKHSENGVGMGLYLVYEIVREYNGTIKVESDPGKGATFNVFLPMVESKGEPYGNQNS